MPRPIHNRTAVDLIEHTCTLCGGGSAGLSEVVAMARRPRGAKNRDQPSCFLIFAQKLKRRCSRGVSIPYLGELLHVGLLRSS